MMRLPAGLDLAFAQADNEGWPAARFSAALTEDETAERGRRLEHHLAEPRCRPAGPSMSATSRPFLWSTRRKG